MLKDLQQNQSLLRDYHYDYDGGCGNDREGCGNGQHTTEVSSDHAEGGAT